MSPKQPSPPDVVTETREETLNTYRAKPRQIRSDGKGDGAGYVQGACDGFEVAGELLDVLEQSVRRTRGDALCGDRGDEIILELCWRQIQAKLQTFARRNDSDPVVNALPPSRQRLGACSSDDGAG